VRELSSLRSRIDKIDGEVLNLLKKRVELAKEIGVLKREKGLPIIDKGREEDVYARLSEKARVLGIAVSDVKSIFREIIKMCTAVQSLQIEETRGKKITVDLSAHTSGKTRKSGFSRRGRGI
jgi:chorismate mutase